MGNLATYTSSGETESRISGIVPDWTREGGDVPRKLSRALVVLVLPLCVAAGACSSDSTAPNEGPAGHDVRISGVFHASGLDAPTQNCTQCHGADLRGGDNGEPSCFSCHDQVW